MKHIEDVAYGFNDPLLDDTLVGYLGACATGHFDYVSEVFPEADWMEESNPLTDAAGEIMHDIEMLTIRTHVIRNEVAILALGIVEDLLEALCE